MGKDKNVSSRSGLLSCSNCGTWPVVGGEAVNGRLMDGLFVVLRHVVYILQRMRFIHPKALFWSVA